MVYAYAALERGFPYVNSRPRPALAVPALQELALKHNVPICGNDGKTGETLVKTVLAPMFRARNLEVLSWEGFNILGGGDGRVLDDRVTSAPSSRPRARPGRRARLRAARRVRIEYVPSLGKLERPRGTSSTSEASSAPR